MGGSLIVSYIYVGSAGHFFGSKFIIFWVFRKMNILNGYGNFVDNFFFFFFLGGGGGGVIVLWLFLMYFRVVS